MNLQDLPLRKRLLVGFVGIAAALAVIGVVVGVQYLVTYSGAVRLQERLTPAAELADNLLLAQSSASGDLSDYVLTDRNRARNAHLDSVSDADAFMRALEATLDQDPALLGQLSGVRAAQQVWLNDDATPTLELMAEGDQRGAARATNRAAAWESFDAMIAATFDFREAILIERNTARDRVDSFARQLGWWLAILALAVLLIAASSFVALQSWVLQPLRAIRRDIRKAAGESHVHPVAETGPPDLRAVAKDTEYLRRSLVAEIDEARAARTGLAQDAPLVAQMRSVFEQRTPAQLAGVHVAGTSSSAEGVLAGDWWDTIEVDANRLALVIADTSGHGTSAIITALRVKDLLRGALATGLEPSAAAELAAVSCRDDDNFVTAFIAIIDTSATSANSDISDISDMSAGSMTFTNAGHQPAVIVTADKETVLCEGTGPLLSSLGGSWSQRTVPFNTGDCLIAFTDGLIEGHGADDSDLGPEDISRIIRSLDAPVRQDAHEVLARVIASIRARSTTWQHDDVTAVALSRPVMAI
jgi:sigma-B regulation protein RsbU (phosphoserine phosphatase)